MSVLYHTYIIRTLTTKVCANVRYFMRTDSIDEQRNINGFLHFLNVSIERLNKAHVEDAFAIEKLCEFIESRAFAPQTIVLDFSKYLASQECTFHTSEMMTLIFECLGSGTFSDGDDYLLVLGAFLNERTKLNETAPPAKKRKLDGDKYVLIHPNTSSQHSTGASMDRYQAARKLASCAYRETGQDEFDIVIMHTKTEKCAAYMVRIDKRAITHERNGRPMQCNFRPVITAVKNKKLRERMIERAIREYL